MSNKGRPKKEEAKKQICIRVYPSELKLIIKQFGSSQRAMDYLIKEIKGE